MLLERYMIRLDLVARESGHGLRRLARRRIYANGSRRGRTARKSGQARKGAAVAARGPGRAGLPPFSAIRLNGPSEPREPPPIPPAIEISGQ